MQRSFDGKTFMVTGAGTEFGAALAGHAREAGDQAMVVPGDIKGTMLMVHEFGQRTVQRGVAR